MKKFLKYASVVLICALIFFGCSYFYLNKNLKTAEMPAGKNRENVPYRETPENCGLRFFLPGKKVMLIFLDFTEQISYIINIDSNNTAGNAYAGYGFSYDFTLDYSVLSELFDRLGGLDLDINGEALRLTGVEVCDRLCRDNSGNFAFNVANAVCGRLAADGFSGDDFVYLLENSGTNLTVPVCIYWQPHIKKMFANAVFVNWVI